MLVLIITLRRLFPRFRFPMHFNALPRARRIADLHPKPGAMQIAPRAPIGNT